MKLTKNFNLDEFSSKDGAEFPCEVKINLKELALNLQVLRDALGLPIHINSGYRSPAHNKAVVGAKNSQHLLGKAGDITVNGYSPFDIKSKIEGLIKQGKIKNGGVGLYNTFVHYDVRDYAARW